MMPPFMSARRPKLEGLRGVAILLVLAKHSFVDDWKVPCRKLDHAAALPVKLAGTGVDLFSVLSGYLFGILLANRLRTFELSRFARLESGRGLCIEALAQSCCPCELHRCVQGCSRKVQRSTRRICPIGRKDQKMNTEDDPIPATS